MNKNLLTGANLLRASLFTFCLASSSMQAQQNALEFDGTNDYIVTNYAGISGNASRTVEAWIKVGSDSSQRFLVDMGDTAAGAGSRFSFKINPSASVIRIEIGGAGINGSAFVTNNQWHHVAVVYDNDAATNKYKLYVDGVLDIQGDMTTALNVQPGTTNMTIGIRADLSATTVWDGAIDEVRVWDVARTQAQIQDNMNTEFCNPQANLVSYYKFNEGTAGADNATQTTISDSSANTYTGTLNSFALSGTGSNFIAGATALTAVTIDDSVTLDGTTLTAAEATTGTTYQWVDCDNEDAPIDEATSQTFTPTATGNYAVIITKGGCSAQSECTAVTIAVCESPTAVMTADITTAEATISWTENGDATQWEVLYGPTGFNPETEGETVTVETTAEMTLDELDANTGYDVYVRAVCSEDFTSEWTAVTAFTTLEEVVVTPVSNVGVNFDGVDDFIQTTYGGVSGSGARTVEGWIRTTKNSLPTNQGGQGQSVIADWGTLGTSTRFTFCILNNNALRLEVQGSAVNGTVAVNDGEWHHVAVVYNPTAANKIALYLDGVLDIEGNVTANTGSTTNFRLGARIDGVNFFQGDMDNVRVWNVARTQAELQANMNTEFCGPQTNLKLNFRMNDGTPEADNAGVSLSDNSGNNYLAVFNGFALNGTGSNFVDGLATITGVTINDEVTLEETTLTATEAATGTTYQWVDCDNEDAPIDEATSQTFTPTASGNYAVIVTNSGCSVQSDCMEVTLNTEVCAVPTGIMVEDITTSSASVSWTESGDATTWEVLYGPTGFDVETEGETVAVDTTAEVMLDELDANTGYDVYVRAVCGEDLTSELTVVEDFTTLEEVVVEPTEAIALNFDGAGDYIQTNYQGVLGNNARTVEAWVKTNSGNNEQIIATWGSDAVNGARFTFRLNASGTNDVVRIENKGGGINGTVNVNDGNWHHVAVTYDNSLTTNKYKLYVDGVLDTQGDISTPLNTMAVTDMIIGRRINASFGGYFDGSIDEVRVWSVARTQAEIAANKDAEFCGVQPNLQAYFKLNEGTPEADNTAVASATDASGNGYVGTFNTFALNGLASNYIAGAVDVNESEVDDAVALVDATITAAQTDAVYQWVDCNDNNADIEGATNQSFTATESGNYAVRITANGCTVLSECTEIVIEVCAVPIAVAVTEIGETTATVAWTENGTSTEWEVLYGPTGFDVATEGETVTVEDVAMVVLDELDADTEYDVYVRAVCSETSTDWTVSETFTTDAAPVCVTPSAIQVTEITSSSAMISWTENGEATIWEVLYGPVGFDIETEGETVTIDNTPEVMLDELDANTEYNIYVRAVCAEDFTSSWGSTDSFTTLEEALCSTPSTIVVSEITSSSVMVSWTENGEATVWEVLYGPVGFDIETEGETVTVEDTPEVMLDELDANTEYDVYVRAVCGEDFTSNWESTQPFTTLEEAVCATPSQIEITDTTSSSAMVSWTENGEATVWEVLYGPAGFDPETEGEIVTVENTPEVMLDELDPETEYHVYVRAICAEEMVSEWEGQESFTTQTLGLNDNTIAGFAFYPNPTNGTLNISAQNYIESVVIYNLTGQKVMAVKVEASASQLDVAKLSEGVYMMHVTSEAKTGVYKLVRK
ncbi:T9SS type A sorting domain-containing protein [Flavobacterium alkalisoli]|uniref:T9SS type A sorting domain-containing protein n=1 Tax=Flavobacterium alkalisoli TaxID=2602769 RepID=A0A5B9FYC5_9FLAO|nr:LamG-like jellyroll fold domain-containing protein [Flavobacterium alkalisoli]QEE50828.1 T9SS type A sorting domain-containing protein [Flavobacterium alkalisoli]